MSRINGDMDRNLKDDKRSVQKASGKVIKQGAKEGLKKVRNNVEQKSEEQLKREAFARQEIEKDSIENTEESLIDSYKDSVSSHDLRIMERISAAGSDLERVKLIDELEDKSIGQTFARELKAIRNGSEISEESNRGLKDDDNFENIRADARKRDIFEREKRDLVEAPENRKSDKSNTSISKRERIDDKSLERRKSELKKPDRSLKNSSSVKNTENNLKTSAEEAKKASEKALEASKEAAKKAAKAAAEEATVGTAETASGPVGWGAKAVRKTADWIKKGIKNTSAGGGRAYKSGGDGGKRYMALLFPFIFASFLMLIIPAIVMSLFIFPMPGTAPGGTQPYGGNLRNMRMTLQQDFDNAIQYRIEDMRAYQDIPDENILNTAFNPHTREIIATWYYVRSYDVPHYEVPTGHVRAIDSHTITPANSTENFASEYSPEVVIGQSCITPYGSVRWLVQEYVIERNEDVLDEQDAMGALMTWGDLYTLEAIAGEYNLIYLESGTGEAYGDSAITVDPDTGAILDSTSIVTLVYVKQEEQDLDQFLMSIKGEYNLDDITVERIRAAINGEDEDFNWFWAWLNANDPDATDYGHAVAYFAVELWSYFGQTGWGAIPENVRDQIEEQYGTYMISPKNPTTMYSTNAIYESDFVDDEDRAMWGTIADDPGGDNERWDAYFYRSIGYTGHGGNDWCNAFVSFCYQHGNGIDPIYASSMETLNWGHAFPVEYCWHLGPSTYFGAQTVDINSDFTGVLSSDMSFSVEEQEHLNENTAAYDNAVAESQNRTVSNVSFDEMVDYIYDHWSDVTAVDWFSVSFTGGSEEFIFLLTDPSGQLALGQYINDEYDPDQRTFVETVYGVITGTISQGSSGADAAIEPSMAYWPNEHPYSLSNLVLSDLHTVNPGDLYLYTNSYLVSFCDPSTGAGLLNGRSAYYSQTGGLGGQGNPADDSSTAFRYISNDCLSITGSANGGQDWFDVILDINGSSRQLTSSPHTLGSYTPNFTGWAWVGEGSAWDYTHDPLGGIMNNPLIIGPNTSVNRGSFDDLVYLLGYRSNRLNSSYVPIVNLFAETEQRVLALYPASQVTCQTTLEYYRNLHSDWCHPSDEVNQGDNGYVPEAGDLLFSNYDGFGTYNHIQLIIGTFDNVFVTIGGNQGNTISISYHTLDPEALRNTIGEYYVDIPY